ncbi:hypothetical protein J4G37_48300, partial [Microvirga sp. 3-52]|nr:hypothetical protein [Microvirga sp. 3-52]
LILEMNQSYYDTEHRILDGSLPIKQLYGKFPEFLEVMAVVKNIYGEDFMEIFERGITNIESTFDSDSGELTSARNSS